MRGRQMVCLHSLVARPMAVLEMIRTDNRTPFHVLQAAGLSVIAVEKATGQPLQYGLFAWVRGGPLGLVQGASAGNSGCWFASPPPRFQVVFRANQVKQEQTPCTVLQDSTRLTLFISQRLTYRTVDSLFKKAVARLTTLSKQRQV